MRTTASRREPRVTFTSLLAAGLAGLGAMLARNPVAVGGVTAFLVSFAFVSANALWYQPYFHSGALVSTREPVFVERQPAIVPPDSLPSRPAQGALKPSGDTTGAIAPPQAGESAPGDATLRKVQQVLRELGLYRGAVDGLQGPQTRVAIDSYRRIVGLPPAETLDERLLRQLGLAEPAPAALAAPSPTQPVLPPVPTRRPSPGSAGEPPAAQLLPAATAAEPVVQLAARGTEADPVLMRVQAGLKAFGNDGIAIDGMLDEETRAAISEFQSLFGLPVTGRPDQPFLAKMREVGLIN